MKPLNLKIGRFMAVLLGLWGETSKAQKGSSGSGMPHQNVLTVMMNYQPPKKKFQRSFVPTPFIAISGNS